MAWLLKVYCQQVGQTHPTALLLLFWVPMWAWFPRKTYGLVRVTKFTNLKSTETQTHWRQEITPMLNCRSRDSAVVEGREKTLGAAVKGKSDPVSPVSWHYNVGLEHYIAASHSETQSRVRCRVKHANLPKQEKPMSPGGLKQRLGLSCLGEKIWNVARPVSHVHARFPEEVERHVIQA